MPWQRGIIEEERSSLYGINIVKPYFSALVPAFPFERRFYGQAEINKFAKMYWISPLFGLGYLVVIYYLIGFMRNRKPMMWLNKILPYWNLGLAVFSMIGTSRTLPYLVDLLTQKGLQCALCLPPDVSYANGPPGFWIWVFTISKFFELIDTLFLVLRKKKVSFLHWFHHSTVLLFTFDAFVHKMPAGLIYTSMNYFVHSIMYFYYFLVGINYKCSWGMFVTLLQIVQMVFGIAATFRGFLLTIYYDKMDPTNVYAATDPVGHKQCYYDTSNQIFAITIYVAYLILFMNFFVNRYFTRGSKSRKLN